MTIVCQNCGCGYPNGATFCPHCGREIAHPRKVLPERNKRAVVRFWKCSGCGSGVSPTDAIYCHQCGVILVWPPKPKL